MEQLALAVFKVNEGRSLTAADDRELSCRRNTLKRRMTRHAAAWSGGFKFGMVALR